MPVLSKRVAYGIGVVSVVAIALVTGNIRNDTRAEATTQFAITKVEAPMMAACEDAMGSNNYEFMRNLDDITGCACMTRQIADVSDESDYKLAQAAMEMVLELGDDAKDEKLVMAALPRFKEKYWLDTNKARNIFTNASTALITCSNREAYLSEEERNLVRQEREDAERQLEEERIATQRRAVTEQRDARRTRPDVAHTRETREEGRRSNDQKPRNAREEHYSVDIKERRARVGNPPS